MDASLTKVPNSAGATLVRAVFKLREWQGNFAASAVVPAGTNLTNSFGLGFVLKNDITLSLAPQSPASVDRRGEWLPSC